MNWQTIAAIAGTCGVVGGFFLWFWRRGLPALRKWSRFADHVMGVPADVHTGQAEVPGIFERMDHQDEVLEKIRHEVEYNNGSSVKDAIQRIETRLDVPTPPQTQININPTPPEVT